MSQLRIGCEFHPEIVKKVYKHVWGLEVAGIQHQQISGLRVNY